MRGETTIIMRGINHYYINNRGADFPHLQQMAELRRNQRAETGRRHVMAHYVAASVRFCCHLVHPDQRRNMSDTPWNRDPRPLLLTKNVTGSCTSPSNWCVRMKETRPTDRIRLICTYVKNVFVGIIQICDNDNLQQGLNIQFPQNPAHEFLQ